MSPVPSVGKRVRINNDCFWFYFWLVEEVARDLLTNHKAFQCKTKAIAELLSTLNWKALYFISEILNVFIWKNFKDMISIEIDLNLVTRGAGHEL